MFDFLGAKVAYMRGEYEKAAELFREGAREGDAMASFAYGYCLLYGIGVKCNYAEAKSFFSFADSSLSSARSILSLLVPRSSV